MTRLANLPFNTKTNTMAQESSMNLAIGASLPEFSLPDVSSQALVTPKNFDGAAALLIVFLCRHCPYVVHVRGELAKIAEEYRSRGLAVAGISSNDAKSYPDDAPEKLAEMVKDCKLPFPVLYDKTQETAKNFCAACTPDFFLFDGERKLFYRGRLDESTPGNGKPLTGKDLREAIELLLAGEAAPLTQNPSLGCSIKWF